MTDIQTPTTLGEEVVKNLNIFNIKKVAIVFVVGFTCYHGLIHYLYDPDSCNWLLWDGRFQGKVIWQPYGCMMHTYANSDIRNCMQYNAFRDRPVRFVFAGDSRIRQLYGAMVRLVSGSPFTQPAHLKHANHSFAMTEISLHLSFIWAPTVNESMRWIYQDWNRKKRKDQPSLIVTGSATWAIKQNNASEEASDQFRSNLTELVPVMDQIGRQQTVVWMVQDPVIEQKLSDERKMITNKQIDLYNKIAMEVFGDSSVRLWKSSRLVSQGYYTQRSDATMDGLHIDDIPLQYDSQILLNLYCNDDMNYYDGTCCSSREKVTTVQIITAVVFGTCMFLTVVLYIYKERTRRNTKRAAENLSLPLLEADQQTDTGEGRENAATAGKDRLIKPKPASHQPVWQSLLHCGVVDDVDSTYTLVSNVARLGLIMAYFFLCDRTNFFMKENKYYTHLNFFLPFGYVIALGLFFTEETKQTQVLHRDITDEWKGWMQLVILIYHITGASSELPIYMHIRVLVSSYLFLTGYGHFFYFWMKGDYGLYRVCQVLFRMNMLVVVLCFVMNRPYQFYYFVPLVSFWFLTAFATMACPPHLTAASTDAQSAHYFYMVTKFVVLIAIITTLFLSEVLFEKIFVTRPWKALFVNSDDSVREWWFRWQLDRYSMVYGMVFAFLIFVLKRFHLLGDSTHEALFSRLFTWLLSISAVVGIGCYATFTWFCRSKPQCNQVHSYIAFIPIVSYIALRNVPGCVRGRSSTFFAWFGRISLELFIGQYHIWLAADTHGVLVLVPNYPVLNVLVTSFIFVCMAHEIHQVTNALAPYAVPKDGRSLLRNVVCFWALLIPLAVSRGMFG